MLSLLGQAAAASRKATSAGVGASMVTSFARSAHMIATPRAAATTTKSSFETTPAILSSIVLRVEPPLPQIPNQVRDRQDRQQPVHLEADQVNQGAGDPERHHEGLELR